MTTAEYDPAATSQRCFGCGYPIIISAAGIVCPECGQKSVTRPRRRGTVAQRRHRFLSAVWFTLRHPVRMLHSVTPDTRARWFGRRCRNTPALLASGWLVYASLLHMALKPPTPFPAAGVSDILFEIVRNAVMAWVLVRAGVGIVVFLTWGVLSLGADPADRRVASESTGIVCSPASAVWVPWAILGWLGLMLTTTVTLGSVTPVTMPAGDFFSLYAHPETAPVLAIGITLAAAASLGGVVSFIAASVWGWNHLRYLSAVVSEVE